MKKEFIKSIYEKNETIEGRESLYHKLSEVELECWQEIEKLHLKNWTTLFSKQVKKYAKNIVIREVETGRNFTYQELEEASDKIKNFILSNVKESKIGLNYHNSFAFIATLIGINKSGRLAILFNNREPENRIKTLANNAEVQYVFGNRIEGLKHFDIDKILNEYQEKATQYSILETTLENPAFVIFTSGTSGPSKPALFSHRRMVGAGVAWSLRTAMESSDNCYIPLPLYHGNALAVAFSSVIYSGATAVLRPKFSVGSFWKDINEYECSHMIYIGELWRYLINQKTTTNPNKFLKVIFGNGLNRALWNSVVERYEIEHVVEHFGATEMPSGALTNWMNVAGYCGYLPLNDARLQEMVLVDETFNPIEKNQNGEALFLVPTGEYRGYLDSTLDAPKLHKNLFTQNDVWWKSGDLLHVNEEGFYTFVERLGDTYRFKGENVACVDVEVAIREVQPFDEVVVYGIELPSIEGKIGMASVVTTSFTLKDANTLLKSLKNRLANHALPYILKVQAEKHTTTSTLKIQKAHLAKEGLNNALESPHYYLIDGKYKLLEQNDLEELLNSKIILGAKS